MTTQAELLVLVQQRYSTLDAPTQERIAAVALTILSEPKWSKIPSMVPMTAVKIASHRVQHRKSF
jgi:hypothetical protein